MYYCFVLQRALETYDELRKSGSQTADMLNKFHLGGEVSHHDPERLIHGRHFFLTAWVAPFAICGGARDDIEGSRSQS